MVQDVHGDVLTPFTLTGNLASGQYMGSQWYVWVVVDWYVNKMLEALAHWAYVDYNLFVFKGDN